LNYFQLRELKPYFIIFIVISMIVSAFHLLNTYIIYIFDTYHILPALLLAGITNTDGDSARYMLSALVQSEATIIAVVITLSLVAVQLAASSYSPRVIKIFIRSPDLWFILSIYVISIVYGLAVLRLIDSENIHINNLEWGISVAFVLGIFNLVILFPYINNTLRLIDPNRIIEFLVEGITKDNIFSVERPGDKNDPLQDIIYIIISSSMRYDVATVDDGLNAIGFKIEFILKNYEADEKEETRFANFIFNHYYNIAKLAISREDETTTLAVIHAITRIGKFAELQKREKILYCAIDSFRSIGLLAAGKRLEIATSVSSDVLKDIGLTAFKQKRNDFACLVLDDIADIGEIAAKEELSGAIWTISEIMGSLGVEFVSQEFRNNTDRIVLLTFITINSLERVGMAAAKEELSDAEMALMDSLGHIGVMAIQKTKEDYASSAISTLETLGIEVSKKGLDDAAIQAGINIREIGKNAISQNIVKVTNEAVDALEKIVGEAINQDLARTPFNIVTFDLQEIGVNVATKEQFSDTKQKVISHLENIKGLADKQNKPDLSSLCSSSIDHIKTSKDGRMYQFEQSFGG